MPRSQPRAKAESQTEDVDLKQRRKRANDWKLFRRNNLFTQKRLAEVIGVSRRTIQQIEGGHITPRDVTLRRFAVFKQKCKVNADLNLQLVEGETDGNGSR
jgi:DNA-binding XRE family transcriptional regulator